MREILSWGVCGDFDSIGLLAAIASTPELTDEAFYVVRSTGRKGEGVRGLYTRKVGGAVRPNAWSRRGPGIE